MKQLSTFRILLFILFTAITLNINAKTTHEWNYGKSDGPTTIYVDAQRSFSHPFPSYITSCRWFLRQGTGNSADEEQETGGAKIVSSNSSSCVIQGLWANANSTSYSNWKLELYCVHEGYSEDYVAIWQIVVKSYGYLRVEASPAGGTVSPGSKVTLTAKSNGNTVSGCDIYYTLDGSTPTKSSTKYTSSGVTIDESCWLTAKAFKTGYESIHIDEWYYSTKQVAVTNISLDKTSTSLSATAPGNTVQLTATVYPSDATDKTVTWTSSNEKVAKVNSNGLVTAVERGSATITCKANDGSNKQATCEVTVSGVKPWTKFTSTTIEGVEMTFYARNDKTCYVYGTYSGDVSIDKATTGTITIPEEVEGCTVTEVGDYAFKGCTGITEVKIPNSVNTIRYEAFRGCSSLNKIDLGSNVTSISSYAFYGCSSLQTITGMSKLESIGSSAFGNTYNTFIPWYNNLPDGPLYLGKVLYKYKGTMPDNTTVSVKEGTIFITSGAFDQCNGLIGLNIPKSVKTIEKTIISFCPNLTAISVADDNEKYDSRNGCNAIVETAKNMIIAGCKATTFPNTITSIGSNAFYGGGWTELVIPNNIDSIGDYAFSRNSSLENVMIGKGLRKIMPEAFSNCQMLKSIAVASANPYLDSRDNCNAIIEKSTNKLLIGCSKTVIPASVKTIGKYSFYSNNNLYTMTIPDNVEKIEDYAVETSYNLRSLTLGKNVKEIGDYVFYGCNALRSIRSLATSPAEIDENVFKGNYTYYPDTVYNNATLYVPVGSKINYMTSTGWNKFKKIVELSDMSEPQEGDIIEADNPLLYAVTNVQNHTCEVAGVKSNVQGNIDIPAQFKGYDVTAIGTDAFYGKKGITKVSIPNSVKELKDYALYSCSDLERIDLPSSLECIGYFALGGLDKVTAIKIPRSVTSIDCGILTADSLLTSITVDEGNTVYDSRGGCNAIIETATDKLVAGCQTTVIPNEIKVIGAYAFNSQKKLKTIRIPDNVTCIDEMAFNNSGLQSIMIPAHVDSIGQYAFRICRQLTAVTSLIMQPLAINENVFYTDYVDGKFKFTSATLYVPIGTKALYEATEGWNKFQNIVEIDTSTELSAKGDVNMDNAVNGTDLVALSNIVLGRKEKTESADVNGDGSVNGTDIVALSNIILGRSSNAPRRAGEAGTGLSIEPFDIQAGEEKEMLIDLTNPNDELTLVQFDLHLPEGLSIKKSGADLDIDMGNRTSWRKHTLDANETDGGYRFLLYSSSNTMIDGTSGAIIKVNVVADASFKGGKIVIDNTLLVSPDEKETKPEAYEYTFPTTDDGSAKLAIKPFDIKAGEEKEMLIDLSNPNDEVTLVQFDLQLPEGLTVKKSGADLVYDMADRTSWRKHTLDANETDGGYRFLLYSSSNTVIDGTEGTIIKVTLTASQDMTGKTIALDNILLVSPDEKETKPARYEYVIGSDTGIRAITIDNDADAPIYNLRGQRLSAPQKGINIIGGKKVVVK